MRQFDVLGYTVRHDAENADGEIVIINTCGFIGDAKEESINTILQFAEMRKLAGLPVTEADAWRKETPWKKATKKNPRGVVTNLSDKARKETEKADKEAKKK